MLEQCSMWQLPLDKTLQRRGCQRLQCTSKCLYLQLTLGERCLYLFIIFLNYDNSAWYIYIYIRFGMSKALLIQHCSVHTSHKNNKIRQLASFFENEIINVQQIIR